MSHKDTRLLKYFKGLILLIKILPRFVDNTFKTLYQPVPSPSKKHVGVCPGCPKLKMPKFFLGGNIQRILLNY